METDTNLQLENINIDRYLCKHAATTWEKI
jgi:hypothetical protein